MRDFPLGAESGWPGSDHSKLALKADGSQNEEGALMHSERLRSDFVSFCFTRRTGGPPTVEIRGGWGPTRNAEWRVPMTTPGYGVNNGMPRIPAAVLMRVSVVTTCWAFARMAVAR